MKIHAADDDGEREIKRHAGADDDAPTICVDDGDDKWVIINCSHGADDLEDARDTRKESTKISPQRTTVKIRGSRGALATDKEAERDF